MKFNEPNITPATRVMEIQEYYFSKKLREVAQLNAQGADIISLGIGGPDRMPHSDIISTLCEEAQKPGNHSYQPYVGIPELRQAFGTSVGMGWNLILLKKFSR